MVARKFAACVILSGLLIFVVSCTASQAESAGTAKEDPSVNRPQENESPRTKSSQVGPQAGSTGSPRANVSFHDKCAVILNPAFVDDKGLVDYRTLKRKRQALRIVLDEFARLDPNEYQRWPKEDKIAFWLNAYNLQMLQIIIDNYPIKATRIHLVFWPPTSIRHIRGIWSDYKFIVMGEQFTLSEVEKRFFRGEFSELRVFFAMSVSSLSGPPLRNEPYCGSRLYEQLDDQVRKFLSNPLAFKVDGENQVVYLSALFQLSYYGDEFVSRCGTDKKFKDQPAEVRAVFNFIAGYIPKETAFYLETRNYSVKYINYDWRLNERSGGETSAGSK